MKIFNFFFEKIEKTKIQMYFRLKKDRLQIDRTIYK